MSYKYPRLSKHRLTVRRSSAGLGLFTESAIKKGDFVIEYFGNKLNNDQADAKGGKYLFAIDDKLTIDGSSRKNNARYLNHSCKPNCEPELDGKRVFIYAKKNVVPGEELTYNYGKEYFDGFITTRHCRCGNHNKKRRSKT